MCFFMFFDGTLEEIEWAIIFIIDKVLKIVFERYPQFIPIVIFSYFKLRFFILIIQIFETPFLKIPFLSTSYINHEATSNDHWFTCFLVSVYKLLN